MTGRRGPIGDGLDRKESRRAVAVIGGAKKPGLTPLTVKSA